MIIVGAIITVLSPHMILLKKLNGINYIILILALFNNYHSFLTTISYKKGAETLKG